MNNKGIIKSEREENNYSLTSRKWWAVILIAITIVSCTSDFINDSFFSSKEEAFTIDKAREYFETFATALNVPNITEESGDGEHSASESRSISKEREKIITPAWERGVEKRKKNTQVVEVPLETDYALYSKVHTIDNEKDTISSAWYYSQSRLMICKKGVDNYSMFQITIVPVAASNSETEQMLEDFEYSGRKGMFSGYVFCSTLDGQCYRIFKYENGEIVKLLNKTVPILTETIRTITCKDEGLTNTDTVAQNIKPKYKFSFSYQALSRYTLIIWERDENGELVGHIGEVTVNPPDDYEEGDELPIGWGEDEGFIYETPESPGAGGSGGNSGSGNYPTIPCPDPNEPEEEEFDENTKVDYTSRRILSILSTENGKSYGLYALYARSNNNCFEACTTAIKQCFPDHGNNFGDPQKTIRLISRQQYDTILLEAFDLEREILLINKTMECIEDHLNNNHPIIVGIDTEDTRLHNDDKTTDHYVVIVGQGYDNNGFFYSYIETGRLYEEDALDFTTNKLYYNPTNKRFEGVCEYRNPDIIYTITHIRPNTNITKWSNYLVSIKNYKY